MASSNAPCAACKVRRCKCTQECVFAPYFPPDQPQKFANVHNVFGASNVAKLLHELDARHREDAVNSLVYEAEFRLRDPVYGCVGLISVLQQTLKQKQSDLMNAKKELASYIGPQAMLPLMQQQYPGNPSSSSAMPYNTQPMMPYKHPAGRSGQLIIREGHQQQQQEQQQLHQQQQLFEAQQLTTALAAIEQQDMIRALEQKEQQMDPSHPHPQLQQEELLRLHNRFDPSQASTSGFNQLNNLSPLEQKEQQMDPRHHHPQLQQQELLQLHSGFDPSPVSAGGFNQLNNASPFFPSLALGTFDHTYDLQPESSEHPHSHSHYHHQQQQQHQLLQLQAQPFLQPQQELLEAQPLLQPPLQLLQAQPLLQTQQQPQLPPQSQLLQQENVDKENDKSMPPSGSG